MNAIAHHLESAARATGHGQDAVAIRHLRKLVRLAPAVPAFWGLLGDRLLAQDAFAAAIQAYHRSLKLHGKHAEDPACPDCVATVAAVHAAIASAHAGAGDLDLAAREYREAIRIDPSPPNFVCLGEVHEMNGRPRRAKSCYRKALRQDGADVPAMLHLAELELWTRPARTRSLCRRVLELEPGHPEALTNLATVYMQQEAWTEAESCVTRALKSCPSARAWVYLGHIRAQRGDVEGARDAYGRAQQADPADVHPVYARGDLEREEGNDGAAEQAYREALELDPSSADAALRLSRLLMDLKREPAEALRLAREGLGRAPHHPWAKWVREWIRDLEQGDSAS